MLNQPNPSAARPLQPLLHDLVSTVFAPASALSGADGQIREAGVQGLFYADSRVLSRAHLFVDGREPEPVAFAPAGPGATRFTALVRWLGDPGPDPTVRIDRLRTAGPSEMEECLTVTSTAAVPVTFTLTIGLSCDFAPIEEVKSGGGRPDHTASGHDGALRWRDGETEVRVTAPGAELIDGTAAGLRWQVALGPREQVTHRWQAEVRDPRSIVTTPRHATDWARPQVTAADHRITRLLDQSLDDLQTLRLAETGQPDDTFLAAGVPWFLTLFGRDSIWAARMMLPLGTGLAAGTLRALARRQGRALDPATCEEPGKIMHELRRRPFHFSGAVGELDLPDVYFGTVDATLLWISLLHDAWRWGMPDDQVAELLPHLEAALGWLDKHADPDGDGFVEYVDTHGHGLANQGWKDSGDAVRFRDGRQADAPIALVEVQGYAYQAAVHGAALLDAYGLAGAERWRDHAGRLAERFRAAYWVDGPHGAFPALALDRYKRPVDSLTSNIGHLLGTGILSEAESAAVAALLAAPGNADAFGLRTMSADEHGYSPLSYHCGTVWAHDTAIAISGLAADGHAEVAAQLAEGLLAAAEAFDYRLPELHSGDARSTSRRPVPYPAACRPQAWSATAVVAVLHAMLGVRPDVPAGRVSVRPLAGAPLGAVTARGLRIGGKPVTVVVDGTGRPTVTGLPTGLTLD
ncbi:glycogen debranching N-terminal domain-containing protein [Catellatospora chokoriensis]|uniref:Amylo-alpha-1,6-glucosidase n=1 Tax=Catellatospora chokoriensis TaxID=310353 RepID=A0A8J3NRW4_9ACTN|nr:glycogen debranching N-terminal domain-containing protein [Catellatospora chokoriensis]GIF89921.1 amylo-alpha-1,6-glucosidase [Catellatospora chokoriensis]